MKAANGVEVLRDARQVGSFRMCNCWLRDSIKVLKDRRLEWREGVNEESVWAGGSWGWGEVEFLCMCLG